MKYEYSLIPFRSGGFINRTCNMGRVYIELPLPEARELLGKLNRPLQCFEGGDPKTCECPDHGRTLT